MLMLPASKVSVPLTVVMFNLSNVPVKVLLPPKVVDLEVVPITILPDATQVLPVIKASVITPYIFAAAVLLKTIKPAVEEVTALAVSVTVA